MGKVLGIGLGRTGTTSLTYALRDLGYHARHCPYRLLRRDERGVVVLDMERAARLDAITDLPVARFYRELDHVFPSSKFILTIRDADSWVCSMRKIFLMNTAISLLPKTREIFYDIYGTRMLSRTDILIERFNAHNREVQAHFADRPGDLLVLDVRVPDALGELCRFLGKPVPPRGAAFPKLHSGRFTTLRNVWDFIAP